MSNKTIWRLVEEDFEQVCKENGLSEEETQEIIDQAEVSFNIHNWYEHIEAFIELKRRV